MASLGELASLLEDGAWLARGCVLAHQGGQYG